MSGREEFEPLLRIKCANVGVSGCLDFRDQDGRIFQFEEGAPGFLDISTRKGRFPELPRIR
jgi:hypothetical protein